MRAKFFRYLTLMDLYVNSSTNSFGAALWIHSIWDHNYCNAYDSHWMPHTSGLVLYRTMQIYLSIYLSNEKRIKSFLISNFEKIAGAILSPVSLLEKKICRNFFLSVTRCLILVFRFPVAALCIIWLFFFTSLRRLNVISWTSYWGNTGVPF